MGLCARRLVGRARAVTVECSAPARLVRVRVGVGVGVGVRVRVRVGVRVGVRVRVRVRVGVGVRVRVMVRECSAPARLVHPATGLERRGHRPGAVRVIRSSGDLEILARQHAAC